MAPIKVILLACGSFNPPTFMHLRMFELARDFLNRGGHYQVVCGILSPVHDNYGKKDLISSTHRCALVRLALQDSDWLYLSDWECNRLEFTPTRLVLQYHQNQVTAAVSQIEGQNNKRPADEPPWVTQILRYKSTGSISVKLLCGADLLESFGVPNLWKESDIATIIRDHGIVVITRNGVNPFKLIYESDLLSQLQNNIVIIQEWIMNDVSSTKIRRSLRRGESVKYLLCNDVINYIKNNALFGIPVNNQGNLIVESGRIEKVSPSDIIMAPIEETDSGNDACMPAVKRLALYMGCNRRPESFV